MCICTVQSFMPTSTATSHLAGDAGAGTAHGSHPHAAQIGPQHARCVGVARAASVLRRVRRPVRRNHLLNHISSV